MAEERTIEQLEQDNPGFGITKRFDAAGVEYGIFYRDGQGRSCHVHCRDKEQIQPLIDRISGRRETSHD